MLPRQFTDPLGSKLPALERSILLLRAMQMLLTLFYAEELKSKVLDLIRATDRLRASLQNGDPPPERVPEGTNNPVDKALDALVADRAITAVEKTEIVGLIDYRNVIAHQIYDLMADVNPDCTAREMVTYAPHLLKKYNYKAVGRLQHFHKLLGGLYKTHHYASSVNFNGLLFRSAEKTFLGEIKRLERKLSKLSKNRQLRIKMLNSEFSLVGMELDGDSHPQHPLSRYDDGRLTKRGVEICYRLLDAGKSPMAVAHLTRLSLVAARKRQRIWVRLGGTERVKADLATLPRRKFYARRDD